ncbi:MAG: hypothetical protein B5766_07050 [Candidatus Lumbricidophila eiseniae]|uniref:Uncharacterized protein n=1 Tax=Candidatus Lumbricidiphila eiseniae TaxID=1969409 RepID=A0A2A6FR98_9MICO|nr:MAG: hypothetical protein B5766_07050 [Candidatus Lumbricidophila eiseniae]
MGHRAHQFLARPRIQEIRDLHRSPQSAVRSYVIDVSFALANAIIIIRYLVTETWTRYRWNGRPTH